MGTDVEKENVCCSVSPTNCWWLPAVCWLTKMLVKSSNDVAEYKRISESIVRFHAVISLRGRYFFLLEKR